MLIIIYTIGCIVSGLLTIYDMTQKVRAQDYVLASKAILAMIWQCALSWVGVAWNWACNHPNEPDFLQDRVAAFLAGCKYIINNTQKETEK